MLTLTALFAETPTSASSGLVAFFQEGGTFMVLLVITSAVATAAILFKFLSLSKSRILPDALARKVAHFDESARRGNVQPILEEFEKGQSTLARLCSEVIRHRGRSQSEIAEAVQSMARAEIVRLQSGMTAIDVVISVAPLLGLLGTASGLVIVFSGLKSDADWLAISAGIGRALKTTIVGMAISVPAIIAQGYFTRKIETYAARLEVLLTQLAHICERTPRPGQPTE
ncbi:biopolymer transport protein ExbB [Haloferula luteola]|uniref:Biopolymer transport protein ExbB n=1 Tax=Haloferula luteola TaxID=595692 RepID=A0A840VCS0_9BACT|nr:MotA/TolQ/ExbB proton channel family protein [Haloferula luteola]MBB5353324.1 biopolymer transport protein ExbB [Haloferula luteola]